MSELPGDTTRLLNRIGSDENARSDIIAHASGRLRQETRRMLRRLPWLRRWDETDDVLHNSLVRLNQALLSVKFCSSKHFWNVATRHIRWELTDLARHYKQAIRNEAGRLGGHAEGEGDQGVAERVQPAGNEPPSLAEWAEFHGHAESLPEDERDVFDLVWYQGKTQAEAADILGISLRTVKRRWQSARLLPGNSLPGGRS